MYNALIFAVPTELLSCGTCSDANFCPIHKKIVREHREGQCLCSLRIFVWIGQKLASQHVPQDKKAQNSKK